MSLVRCNFEGNTASLGTDTNGAVVLADAGDDGPDTEVMLQDCTFTGNGNTAPVLLADNRDAAAEGVFYSDSIAPAVCAFEGTAESSAVCVSGSPKTLALVGDQFPSLSSPWLLEVQEVLRFFGLHI